MELARFRRGFSLVELLVVLLIMITITMAALVNQSSFNKTLLLKNTAYDLALVLRSIESLGLGTRAQSASALNVGYGAHFLRAIPNTPINSFTIFLDSDPPTASGGSACHPLPANGAAAPDARPGDCAYTTNDATYQTYNLGNGILVDRFCITNSSGSHCTDSASNKINTALDIVFSRPNPEPFISVDGTYDATITKACLRLRSITDDYTNANGLTNYRYVSVLASGEINADDTSCP